MSKYSTCKLTHNKILIISYYKKLQAELPVCKVYIEIRNHKNNFCKIQEFVYYYPNIGFLHPYFAEMSTKFKAGK